MQKKLFFFVASHLLREILILPPCSICYFRGFESLRPLFQFLCQDNGICGRVPDDFGLAATPGSGVSLEDSEPLLTLLDLLIDLRLFECLGRGAAEPFRSLLQFLKVRVWSDADPVFFFL